MTATSTTWTRRIGVAMMAAALAMATVLVTGSPVGAQESEGMPDEAEQAKVTKSGFYDAPLANIFPPSVLRSFPPQVICLVQPKPCTGDFNENQPEGTREGWNTFTDGVEQGQTGLKENDPNEPVSPAQAQEGTLPVSVTTGQPRYRAAVAFEVPSVPDGHQVDSFKIYLTPTDPTGGASSPMARQAVLAAMTCVRGCEQEQFEKILTGGCTREEEGPCPAETDPLGVEMCAITSKWDGEPSQDPDAMPEVDCLLGANGRELEDGTWEFDMTYALEDWASGTLPNNGVLITPRGAPNFAFGDPDSTFNKQVTFDGTVRYAAATSEAPDPVSFPTSSNFNSSGTTSATSSTSGSSSGFGSAPSGGSSGGNVSSFSTPASDSAPSEPAPEVAGGNDAAAPQQPATEPVAAGPQQEPGSAWYVWLLAPLFLAGAYLTAQSLTAPASVLAAGSRDGAMTRLLSQQASAAASKGPQLA